MKGSNSFNPGDQLPALLERIERREQSARIRTILFSLLPVALTVALVGYTASTVRKTQDQVDALKTEALTYTTQIDTLKKSADSYHTQSQSAQGDAETYKTQVTELQTQLAEVEKTLSDAVNLSRAVRPLEAQNHSCDSELRESWPDSRGDVVDGSDVGRVSGHSQRLHSHFVESTGQDRCSTFLAE